MMPENDLNAPDAIPNLPVSRWFGFLFKARTDREATVEMPIRDHHLQVEGVVHGGVLSTLADTAAVYLLHPQATERERLTSIEFKLNFLSSAKPEAGPVLARAELVQRGRAISLCGVTLWQQQRRIATGLFTYFTRPTNESELGRS